MEPRSFDRGKGVEVTNVRDLAVLQWSRDLLIAESSPHVEHYRDYLMLQWSRDQLIAESGHELPKGLVAAVLQWSRDQLIAERGAGGIEPPTFELASMEPRSIDRGEIGMIRSSVER